MRPKPGSFSRYRPRVLTLGVLAVIATLIVLSNLSFDVRGENGERLEAHNMARGFRGRQLSYGWPLVWHRYVYVDAVFTFGNVRWQWSAGRLASNVAMWLAMLIAPAAACERALRRYRVRLRWSLRTMLAGIGLAAVLCAWFAAVRNRVVLQDKLIETIDAERIAVERRGPRWLGVVGLDNYRRHIIGVSGLTLKGDAAHEQSGKEDLQRLEWLARLPDLQYLSLDGVDSFTPAMAASLSRFRQLRVLSIRLERLTDDTGEALAALAAARQLRILDIVARNGQDRFEERAHDCMAGIAKIVQLEELYLTFAKIDAEGLARLAGFANLKLLSLRGFAPDTDYFDSEPPLLGRLPPLPRLEALQLAGAKFDGRDLRCLARLPRLKSLHLEYTGARGRDLAILASLQSLEELTIGEGRDDSILSPARLELLQGINRLKLLRIAGVLDDRLPYEYKTQQEGRLRAIAALRQSKPGIVIEGDKTRFPEADRWRAERDTVLGDENNFQREVGRSRSLSLGSAPVADPEW